MPAAAIRNVFRQVKVEVILGCLLPVLSPRARGLVLSHPVLHCDMVGGRTVSAGAMGRRAYGSCRGGRGQLSLVAAVSFSRPRARAARRRRRRRRPRRSRRGRRQRRLVRGSPCATPWHVPREIQNYKNVRGGPVHSNPGPKGDENRVSEHEETAYLWRIPIESERPLLKYSY